VTNTIEALDQFAQALGPMLSPPSPLGESLPGDPNPAPAQAFRSGGDGATGRGGEGATGGPTKAETIFSLSGSPRRPVPPSPRPPIAPSPPRPVPPSSRPPVPPAAPPAAVKAAEAEKSQPVAMRRDGITRKGPRGDWPRRVRLAVLALTIGLGLTRVVRATERAGETYGRQEAVKSIAGQRAPRAHPSPHRPSRRSSKSTRS
jgi:hypothetical protein